MELLRLAEANPRESPEMHLVWLLLTKNAKTSQRKYRMSESRATNQVVTSVA